MSKSNRHQEEIERSIVNMMGDGTLSSEQLLEALEEIKDDVSSRIEALEAEQD